MRIVDIREKTVSIASDIANAYIDFSKMTCSVVAVVTDVKRAGKPVVGFGFNSNGRYGPGCLMRERLVPRVLEADRKSVGSGKSVSVRVDYGGRRILKKKKAKIH